MDQQLINQQLMNELSLEAWQVENVISLLDEGNTIPFIARYRKEAHGTLSDETLRTFSERLTYLRGLAEKKDQVIRTIEELGKMTDELRAIFDKALDGLVGVDYEPIACLGTQIVAGRNYCFLAKATVVYPDAKPKYTLIYVYADLSGNATIMNFADMPVIPNEFDGIEPITEEETLDGGWVYAESPEITDEIKANLEKAIAALVGADYEPVANIATQVVAGTNRCLLCKITPVVPNPVPHYALVYLYEALDGTVELLETVDFDFGALCEY